MAEATGSGKPEYKKEDPFGPRAAEYAKFRDWDPEMLAKLKENLPNGGTCIDVATGTGQLIPTIADNFDKVIACDFSEKQVNKAKELFGEKYSHCQFAVRTAENFGDLAEEATVDAITVGEAFHWFNQEKFWQQVGKVLKPDGSVLILGYSRCLFDDAEMQAAHDDFHKILLPFWEFDQKYLESEYEGTVWPFESVQKVQHMKVAESGFEGFTGFVSSWSSLAKARNHLEVDPYTALAEKSKAYHQRAGSFKFKMPMFMYVLRKFKKQNIGV